MVPTDHPTYVDSYGTTDLEQALATFGPRASAQVVFPGSTVEGDYGAVAILHRWFRDVQGLLG